LANGTSTVSSALTQWSISKSKKVLRCGKINQGWLTSNTAHQEACCSRRRTSSKHLIGEVYFRVI